MKKILAPALLVAAAVALAPAAHAAPVSSAEFQSWMTAQEGTLAAAMSGHPVHSSLSMAGLTQDVYYDPATTALEATLGYGKLHSELRCVTLNACWVKNTAPGKDHKWHPVKPNSITVSPPSSAPIDEPAEGSTVAYDVDGLTGTITSDETSADGSVLHTVATLTFGPSSVATVVTMTDPTGALTATASQETTTAHTVTAPPKSQRSKKPVAMRQDFEIIGTSDWGTASR